jgi:Putative cyclase
MTCRILFRDALLSFVALHALTLGVCFAHAQSDLAHAYRIIAAKTFVDLTHSFGEQTPVWSGSPAADPATHEPYTIAKDGFRTTFYEMVGQYGTHVDPPAHFAESGITMDKIQGNDLAARRAGRHALPCQGSEPRVFSR